MSLEILSFVLYVACVILCVASFLFSVISWILIKKWRQFRHFAFLNLLISGVNFLTWMHLWSQMDVLSIEFFLTTEVILITHVQMSHWQLVTTILIYTALVDVFSKTKVKCKYYVACSFGWILPIIEGLMMIFSMDAWVISWIAVTIVELSILLANIVLYVKVVYSLVCLLMRHEISTREVCGKVLVSTLACVTAGLPPVIGTIVLMSVAEYGPISLLDPNVAILPNLINMLLANVFFLSMKTHRVLWVEYIRRFRTTLIAKQELEMQLPRNEALSQVP